MRKDLPIQEAVWLLHPEECDYQDCANCLQQYMPISLYGDQHILRNRRIDDHEAEVYVQSLAEKATRDWHHTRDRLSIYGDALRSRWRKLSRKARQDMINQAGPDLYQHKFPEQRIGFGLEKPQGPDAQHMILDGRDRTISPSHLSTRQRNGLLLPYLNVETLTADPNRLLSLLHHRSSPSLEDWVSFDVEQKRMGFNDGFLADKFSESCVILHGNDYGRLVKWDKEVSHRWLMVGFPLATLVLEAQSILLGFLRSMVDLLVVPGKSSEGTKQWEHLIASGFKASGEVECWSVYSNQPFSTPPKFDPSKWLGKAIAWQEAAEDHLFLLQVEPPYLQSCADIRGFYFLPGVSEQKPWYDKAEELILGESICDVRIFRHVVQQCEYLISLHDDLGEPPVGPESPPSKRYELGLSILHNTCRSEIENYLGKMRQLIHTTGGFTDSFRYWACPSGQVKTKLKQEAQTRQGQGRLFREQPLLWALIELCGSTTNIGSVNKSLAMRLIDECLTNPEERRRIPKTVHALLAKISFYDLMMTEISHIRPRIRTFDPKDMVEANEESFLAVRYECQAIGRPWPEQISKIAKELHQVCQIPWPKGKKDEHWLAQAFRVRCFVSLLWQAARKAVREACAESGGGTLIEEGRDGEILYFPPLTEGEIERELGCLSYLQMREYFAEVVDEAMMVGNYITARNEKIVAENAAKYAVPQVTWGEDTDEKFTSPTHRAKDKTRAEKVTESPEKEKSRAESPQEAINIKPAPKPTVQIEVNSESIRIFSKMFSRDEEDSKGIVKWQQVVVAMTDAGFAATHCGGSAVSFDPVEGAPMKGSIVFHKPHPEHTVDVVMLHAMGNRLGKWFGWERETFVERKKGK